MDMVRDLDDITFTEWFTQLGGGRGSLDRMWDPIAYALGFVDCDHISVRCMLTMFMLFAIRTEVTCSVLRMLEGSPQTGLRDPIIAYLEERGDKINLGIPCRDIVHEVDEEGKPTRSPQTGLQDPIIAYLEERGVKINSVFHAVISSMRSMRRESLLAFLELILVAIMNSVSLMLLLQLLVYTTP